MRSHPTLRVAMIAGTLGRGGAEKQLVAMARALAARGIDVRVFALTRGEFHEDSLTGSDIPCEWVGAHASPAVRVLTMLRTVGRMRPHVVQATHCFANLYAAVLGRMLGALDVGTVRSDGVYDVAGMGGWAPLLLDAPRAMLANSEAGAAALRRRGRSGAAVHVLANVVDLHAFDGEAATLRDPPPPGREDAPVAIAVGTLAPVKAFERFIDALALARRSVPALEGWLVGDGTERAALQSRAADRGLGGALHFLGRRADVPALLRRADVLVLTSRHEGMPNAVLEAMSAARPVVATDAGDAARLVRHGETGYVVPQGDASEGGDRIVVASLAGHLVRLASDPATSRRLGEAGRRVVEREYSAARLGERLLHSYASMADHGGRHGLARQVAACLA